MRRASTLALMLAVVLTAASTTSSKASCKEPDWRRKPTDRDLLAIWPRAAIANGISGSAEISCTVSVQGALHDCTVLREDPVGVGFGQAAVALTPQFTMFPKLCDGRPVESTVRIPLRFPRRPVPTLAAGSRIPIDKGLFESEPTLIDRPAWIAAPTYAQVVEAYPLAARKRDAIGHVSLRCDIAAEGRLRGCELVSEVPTGQGFEEAARALAKDFIAPETDDAGRKTRRNQTVVAFTFDPSMLNGPSPVIGKPQWTHVPQSVDLAAGFPAAAVAAHVSIGRVVMACDVGPGGHLAHCVVSRQTPEGLGFDRAALALSAVFQVSVWTDEGLPTVGGHIVVPIRYEAPPSTEPATPP
jgi:TonB family protein